MEDTALALNDSMQSHGICAAVGITLALITAAIRVSAGTTEASTPLNQRNYAIARSFSRRRGGQ